MKRMHSLMSSIQHLVDEPSTLFGTDMERREAVCGWAPAWPYRWADDVPPDYKRMCDVCDRVYRQMIADDIKAG